MLSPGECQRLAFIRLFYHRPSLAFLDEATSALPKDMEDKLIRMTRELGITMVTVGHRETLRKHHQWQLKIGLPDAGWELDKIQQES